MLKEFFLMSQTITSFCLKWGNLNDTDSEFNACWIICTIKWAGAMVKLIEN